MKYKPFISLLVVSAIFTSIFALSSYAVSDSTMLSDSSIEAEISEREQEIFDDIYNQLKAQNAEILFDTYKEILAPQIRDEIYYIHGYPVANRSIISSYSRSYTFTYGGYVTYLKSVPDSKPTEVAVLNLDYDDSYAFVLNSSSSFTIQDLATTILGYAPNIGAISSIVSTMNSMSTKASYKSISSAGGYAQIINTYSREYDTKASIVTGWYSHPSYSTPSDAYSITATTFSKH